MSTKICQTKKAQNSSSMDTLSDNQGVGGGVSTVTRVTPDNTVTRPPDDSLRCATIPGITQEDELLILEAILLAKHLGVATLSLLQQRAKGECVLEISQLCIVVNSYYWSLMDICNALGMSVTHWGPSVLEEG